MFIVKEDNEKIQADIRIIGVGGAGNNMIETMIKDGIDGVEFIAVNTDHQALESSSAKTKIQIGAKLTKGLGAGANPEIGRRASVESYEEIVNCLKGADMVFVTAGMGGGTGTGSAPFIAQSAHELGILTVGIVTMPFVFEGHKRTRQAKRGISELSQYVDTLIVVPNERLLSLSEKDTPLLETFKLTDEVLLQAVKGISELVSAPGLINLDFADIKTVMRNKGMALMGRGCAGGSNRAEKALKSAISSPLLGGLSIEGATGIIVNVTADSSLSLSEFTKANSFITKMADPSADIIVGTVIDEEMKDQLSVTVIATGFNNTNNTMDFDTLSSQEISPDTASQSSNLEDNPLPETNSSEDQNSHQALNKYNEDSSKELDFIQNSDEMEDSVSTKDSFENRETSQTSDSISEKNEDDNNLSNNLSEAPLPETSSSPESNSSEESVSEAPYPESSSSEESVSEASHPESSSSEESVSEAPHPESSSSEDQNFKISEHHSEHSEENKKPSLRDILLSKSKEYQRSQENQSKTQPEKQMDMNLKEEYEELSSPFEADVDLSDQDLS